MRPFPTFIVLVVALSGCSVLLFTILAPHHPVARAQIDTYKDFLTFSKKTYKYESMKSQNETYASEPVVRNNKLSVSGSFSSTYNGIVATTSDTSSTIDMFEGSGINEYKAEMEELCAHIDTKKHHVTRNVKSTCPCIPYKLKGPSTGHAVDETLLRMPWPDIVAGLSHVEYGGKWRPRDCNARSRIAVIVPYRDRELHLKVFLSTMHPILQRQKHEYQIFVIEQHSPAIFNKGAIMNAAYLEANKNGSWDCFIFHDVDIIMEDDRNLLYCRPHTAVHLVASLDRWNYSLKYEKVFGGAIQLPGSIMDEVDGFANEFFGWGGEDDNMFNRIHSRSHNVTRPSQLVARYRSITHDRDLANFPDQSKKMAFGRHPQYIDGGLSTIRYVVTSMNFMPLYTHIEVDLNVSGLPMPDTVQFNYTSHPHSYCFTSNSSEVLIVSQSTCKYRCDNTATCRAFTYVIDPIRASFCLILLTPCAERDVEDDAMSEYFVKDQMTHKGLSQGFDEWSYQELLAQYDVNGEIDETLLQMLINFKKFQQQKYGI